MVYSLSENYRFNEMNKDQILALLGESTAYYEYDEFPAYLLVQIVYWHRLNSRELSS